VNVPPRPGASAQSLVATLRALPRPVVMLLCGVIVNRLGTLFPLFLVLYVTSLGFRPAQAGLLLTAYGAGTVAGAVVGGWVVDRFGVKSAIVGSMALAGGAVGALPLLSSYRALLLLCAATGLLTELYRPAAATMIAALMSPENMVVTAAAYRLALNIGATLGPLLGAALAVYSLPLVFVVDAVTSVLFALIALTQLPAVRPTAAPASEQRGGYVAVLGDRRFRCVLTGMFLIALVEVQYLAALPLDIEGRGLPTAVYAGLVSLNALLVIVTELPITRLIQRCDMRRIITIGVGLIGLGIALMGIHGGLIMLIVATLVWTSGEVASAPSAIAYPALAAPEPLRGRYVGAMNASQSVGYAVGPGVGTLLYEYSHPGLWTGCAVVGVTAAAAMWLGVRDPRHAAGDGLEQEGIDAVV
jgi:MFS family permease